MVGWAGLRSTLALGSLISNSSQLAAGVASPTSTMGRHTCCQLDIHLAPPANPNLLDAVDEELVDKGELRGTSWEIQPKILLIHTVKHARGKLQLTLSDGGRATFQSLDPYFDAMNGPVALSCASSLIVAGLGLLNSGRLGLSQTLGTV